MKGNNKTVRRKHGEVYGSRFNVPFSASQLPYSKGLGKTKEQNVCGCLKWSPSSFGLHSVFLQVLGAGFMKIKSGTAAGQLMLGDSGEGPRTKEIPKKLYL